MAVSPNTRSQVQSTSYGDALTLAEGTEEFEAWFEDSGAVVAGVVEITASGGAAAELPVAAGSTYYTRIAKGTGPAISLRCKAASGTPTLYLLET